MPQINIACWEMRAKRRGFKSISAINHSNTLPHSLISDQYYNIYNWLGIFMGKRNRKNGMENFNFKYREAHSHKVSVFYISFQSKVDFKSLKSLFWWTLMNRKVHRTPATVMSNDVEVLVGVSCYFLSLQIFISPHLLKLANTVFITIMS